ncbi:hypothetical protein A3410_17870 [Escherichia coli]|uniref:hypothetical protein n=1 Tax=Escherichia coli TaxID=562 RepID=UPI000B959266|nr:hypothetical protein [Escherichia coli]OYG83163.1 hypothetical protein CI732_04805 [Shigella boydii]EFO4689990.1 hypothetical protein [Escherichia coli]MBI1473026.1 hypothetical protein [Escherichia coli]MBI1482397.1 hypothetical protein [Escherichia coli]MBI1487168.1 hypothetical protein [Escherichia coli]
MQSRITESRRFTVDGYTVTFAAGVKRGEAVVVFGIMTGLETVPVLALLQIVGGDKLIIPFC